MTVHASVSPERRYQMTRLRAGDYLLPSNDGRSLWRISRYREDGSLQNHDGTKVVGWFWRAARHHDPLAEIAPHVLGGDHVDGFLEWDRWREHACLLETRQAAIYAALTAEGVTP